MKTWKSGGWTNGQTDGQEGGWVDGQMDGWTDGRSDGWMAVGPTQPSATSPPRPSRAQLHPCAISAPSTKASSRAAAFCLPPSLGGYGGTEGLVAPLGDAWAVRGSLLWEMPMGCRWSLGMGTLSCCGGSVPPPAAQWGSWALCRHQTHLGGTHGALPRRHPHRGAHRGPRI